MPPHRLPGAGARACARRADLRRHDEDGVHARCQQPGPPGQGLQGRRSADALSGHAGDADRLRRKDPVLRQAQRRPGATQARRARPRPRPGSASKSGCRPRPTEPEDPQHGRRRLGRSAITAPDTGIGDTPATRRQRHRRIGGRRDRHRPQHRQRLVRDEPDGTIDSTLWQDFAERSLKSWRSRRRRSARPTTCRRRSSPIGTAARPAAARATRSSRTIPTTTTATWSARRRSTGPSSSPPSCTRRSSTSATSAACR